jgi:peptidoglycan/LPS O-acetylase OafA/YrhL
MTIADSNFNRIEAVGGHYRPDIDGLRAVAVLPVVFYHYSVPPFSGGFVGVDVFFVISGYLITGLIWNEIRAGSFSLLDFYERRVRRIFPALFAMLAVTTLASAFLLFPHTLLRFAISLLATAGFVSNFHFWGEAGYWAADSVDKPLLHTWSLAVEEQFYLLFPGLLYLLRTVSSQRMVWVLGGMLLISMAISVVGVYFAPISTFYLLPARFWELLIGGVLAVGRFPVPTSNLARNALSVIGLLLIAWAVFTLTPSSLFPGANAIPPCLGTALIIYAGSGEPIAINNLLAARWVVFIGLISYSLYLWHWPIYVLAEALLPGSLNAGETALAIAASFVLAVLSWQYVEKPFRGRSSPISRKALFITAGSAIAVAVLASVGLTAARGLPQRFDAATRTILAEVDDYEPLRSRCFDLSPQKVAKGAVCKIGANKAAPSFLLWGDSHADALMPAIEDAALKQNKTGFVAAHGHCAPLVGITFLDRKCRPFNDAAMKIALGSGIDTVVLDALWASPAGEVPIVMTNLNAEDQSKLAPKNGEERAAFSAALLRTVKMLTAAQKKVILVGPVPEFRRPVPVDLAKMRVWGGHWEIAPTRDMYLAREAFVFSVFQMAAKNPGVTIVRADRILCPGDRCLTMVNGRPLYRDTSHLSVFGSHLLTPMFDSLL